MSRHRVKIRVNGHDHEAVEIESRLLLVDFLRENLGYTGTHVGCDTTHCGACTVLMDGVGVKSCTVLAVQADGREVLTIEGLAKDGEMHPIQKAFWDHHALQCGFCTAGMIMSASSLLSRNRRPTEQDIRRGIAGNLCRCTGYQSIVDAIFDAGATMRGE